MTEEREAMEKKLTLTPGVRDGQGCIAGRHPAVSTQR